MKAQPSPPASQEVELKLSLPGVNPAKMSSMLAELPLFANCNASWQSLRNIYYDTPGQDLRQQRVALRLRCVGDAAHAQWLQTLKTSGQSDSALSRRGEWECPVPTATLSRDALQHTPWPDLDPTGEWFELLAPCFETNFERTQWLLTRPDGALIEVALDIGQIQAGTQQAPICELELELKAGSSAALFAVARQIATHLAVLPAAQSKAERGFLLAQGQLGLAQRAVVTPFGPKGSQAELARQVLNGALTQFTANLSTLYCSDDPEVVHQARVGWRRFRSALRLFKKIIAPDALPDWSDLHSLLFFLGELRNLDVALSQTLPPLASAYAEGDPQRALAWQDMLTTLTEAAALQRKAVRLALQGPNVGLALLTLTEWLDQLVACTRGELLKKNAMRAWARARVTRLQRRLILAQASATTPEQQHRARIHAKRLRYAVLALREWLPQPLAAELARQSQTVQTTLGATRDLLQASALVAAHEGHPGLVEFLRGVVVGASQVSLDGEDFSS